MPSEIFLIRHGQSTFNAAFDALGVDPLHFDAALTEVGREQVQKARRELSRLPTPDVVVCSPLRRAIQTATGLFEGLNVPLEITALHRERQDHSCDVGRSPAALAAEFPHVSFQHLDELWWHQGPLDARGVAVEPHEIFVERVQGFRDLLASRPERVVMVVGHGAFFRHLTGRPFANCEIVRWSPA